MSWIFSSWQLTSCIGWFHLAVIGSSRPRPPAPIFLAHNASIMRCWLVNNIVSSAARPSSPHSSISIILYYLYLHTDRCVCKRFFTMFGRGHTRRRCLQAPAPTIQSTFFILTLLATISEYCTLHSEHNQTSLTCLPEVPVWQCCYWSVAAPPTSGRPAGPGCSSAGLNSKCVFISTSTSKYWALAPHLALWQQNWEQYDCYYATWIIAPLKVKFIDSKIDVA